MAKFSQSFLESMLMPGLAADARQLGAYVGAVPGKLEERKKKRQLTGMLKGAVPGTAEYSSILADYYSEVEKDPEKAGIFGARAKEQAETQAAQIKEERTKKERLGVALQKARDLEDRESLDALRTGALDPAEYLRSTAVPSERFKVVGNRVYDFFKKDYIEPSTVAELLPLNVLEKVVTPKSLIDYVKSRNVEDLEYKTGDKPTEDVAAKLTGTNVILDVVSKAINTYEDIWPVTYAVGKEIPLTASKELEGYVKTIQANLAFDRLQTMRDQSKTGGALGNVSNIELDLLKSALTALDPSSRNFKEQLQAVEEHYKNFEASLTGQKPVSDRYQIVDGNLLYEDSQGNIRDLGVFNG
jgi:hypothetical protein